MKKILLTLLAITTLLSFAFPASAFAEPSTAEISTVSIQPFAEITEWKYRTLDGRIQKRLWSVSYGIWLTEWTYV